MATLEVFGVPKRGRTDAECEDAFAISADGLRVALADGASTAAFSGEWARALCETFVGASPGSAFEEVVDFARERFQAWLDARDLAWHAIERLAEGTHAAFLGLQFSDRRVDAVAVGDTCLLARFRDEPTSGLPCGFPIDHADRFGTDPVLIGSLPGNPPLLRASRLTFDLHGCAGLYLATDALARWALERLASGQPPWSDLDALAGEDDFERFIDSLRAAGQLANDDTTLIRLTDLGPRARAGTAG